MPVTAIIFFIGILPILFFSEYQSFKRHPASAGWFTMPVNQPLIVAHYNINAMVSALSPFCTFKRIA
jgi:hypothetical protein